MKCITQAPCYPVLAPGLKPKHYRQGEIVEWGFATGDKDNPFPEWLKPVREVVDEDTGKLVPEPVAGQSRDHKILAAVAQLNPDIDEHWTADGYPRVDAVIELVHEDVTRSEVSVVCPGVRRDNLGGANR